MMPSSRRYADVMRAVAVFNLKTATASSVLKRYGLKDLEKWALNPSVQTPASPMMPGAAPPVAQGAPPSSGTPGSPPSPGTPGAPPSPGAIPPGSPPVQGQVPPGQASPPGAPQSGNSQEQQKREQLRQLLSRWRSPIA